MKRTPRLGQVCLKLDAILQFLAPSLMRPVATPTFWHLRTAMFSPSLPGRATWPSPCPSSRLLFAPLLVLWSLQLWPRRAPASFGSVLVHSLLSTPTPVSRLDTGSSGPFLHPRPCISWVLLAVCLVRRPHLYVYTQGSACFLNFTSHSHISSLVWLLSLLTSTLSWHGSLSHVYKQTQVKLRHTLQCSKPFSSPVSLKGKVLPKPALDHCLPLPPLLSAAP